MNKKYKNIKINQINIELSFSICNTAIPETLIELIKEHGIFIPLLVAEYKNKYVIIDGWKRYEITKKLNLKEIPISIVDWKEKITLFKIAIIEKHRNRDLNVIEIAKIIQLGKRWELNDTETKQLCTLLNIPITSTVIDEYLKLLEYPKSFVDYLYKYGVSIKQTSKLVLYANKIKEMSKIIDIANSLSIRPVELIQIAENIFEISRRKDISFLEVIKEMNLELIVNDKDKDRSKKIYLIKKTLKEYRNPHITKYNKTLQYLKSKLQLTSQSSIKWDKFMENYGITLEARITNENDITQLISDLKQNYEKFIDIIKSFEEFDI